jgi:hypothetical protein
MTDPDEFLKFFKKQFSKYMKGCIARCIVVHVNMRNDFIWMILCILYEK